MGKRHFCVTYYFEDGRKAVFFITRPKSPKRPKDVKDKKDGK